MICRNSQSVPKERIIPKRYATALFSLNKLIQATTHVLWSRYYRGQIGYKMMHLDLGEQGLY